MGFQNTSFQTKSGEGRESMRTALIASLSALLLLAACEKAIVTHHLGEKISSNQAGLKVEWVQQPISASGESSGDFRYGQSVREGGVVEWEILRLTNETDQPIEFLTGNEALGKMTIRLRTLIRWSNSVANGRYPNPSRVQEFESYWEASNLGMLRENGRLEPLNTYLHSETEPLPEPQVIAPGEVIRFRALIRPYDSPLLPSAPLSHFGNQTGLFGLEYVRPGPRPGLQNFDVFHQCRALFVGAIRVSLYRVDPDRVSVSSIALGSPLIRRSIDSPKYLSGGASASLCDQGEGAPEPLIVGIPIYLP